MRQLRITVTRSLPHREEAPPAHRFLMGEVYFSLKLLFVKNNENYIYPMVGLLKVLILTKI